MEKTKSFGKGRANVKAKVNLLERLKDAGMVQASPERR